MDTWNIGLKIIWNLIYATDWRSPKSLARPKRANIFRSTYTPYFPRLITCHVEYTHTDNMSYILMFVRHDLTCTLLYTDSMSSILILDYDDTARSIPTQGNQINWTVGNRHFWTWACNVFTVQWNTTLRQDEWERLSVFQPATYFLKMRTVALST